MPQFSQDRVRRKQDAFTPCAKTRHFRSLFVDAPKCSYHDSFRSPQRTIERVSSLFPRGTAKIPINQTGRCAKKGNSASDFRR
mmetsp:Transcript_13346/g.36882  ORF Transcript_13346/g.36882 Transcript_13346/m.36882 type:complete len:83 (-) Transcript_13346:44-292(-)